MTLPFWPRPSLLLAGLVIGSGWWGESPAAEPPHAAERLFVRRIAPLLQQKCQACHGGQPDPLAGGLDLRSAAGLEKGGDSGRPAVVPHQPEQSPLYLAVLRDADDYAPMPPKEAERLTQEQIGWVRAWIAAGAPWPDETRQAEIRRMLEAEWSAEDGVPVTTSGGLTAEWTQRRYQPEALWAYRPVLKPHGVGRGPDAIDALLQARCPAGLAVAPPAERGELLRRVTFDLTGLPPTPEELADFLADPRPDEVAYAAVVERLLASPHYGERMAQHWLDVVRYADSSGFSNDYERGNAWRYRDYVVRSFNADKPYDQFLREQLAGDELDPDDPEFLIATGFLRMGPWELTGMEVAKVARQRFLDDVTNTVGEALLAHPLQCARCHDHKFDPVPTRDYYALQAVFATTQLAERPAPFLPVENTLGFEERRHLELRRQDLLAHLEALDDRMLQAAERWFAERALDPTTWQHAVAQARQQVAAGKRRAGNVFHTARSLLLARGVPEDQFPPKLLGLSPHELGIERVARKGLERLAWELERYEPYALAVYNGRTPEVKSVTAPQRIPADRETSGELETTCILRGGDPFSPGEPVTPGVLSVLHDVLPPPEIPPTLTGRRTAFAQWVTDPRNPLTTRSIVNRVWMWHFGRPLAGHPNNFGATGKPPTHPELLDWLAATFVEEGWSLKRLHRHILLTAAYRRSSRHPQPPRLQELDPLATSYAVFLPRRLSAEELRDAQLAATGELNRQLGGIPNRPEIHPEIALQPRQVMGTFAAAWTPNPLPAQRHRRTLYALKWRGLPDPFREVFNAPSPDVSCERRDSSTVTPQVFCLFNSQASQARALALAARVLEETTSPEQALERCFLLLFARKPTPAETARCLDHWREMAAFTVAAVDPPLPPRVIRREAVEENTGEYFTFEETLHAHAEFVPDLLPSQVDGRTRALAEVCLVLFNTHEFVYVP